MSSRLPQPCFSPLCRTRLDSVLDPPTRRPAEFVRMLNEVRKGKMNEETVLAFRAMSRLPRCPGGLKPVEL